MRTIWATCDWCGDIDLGPGDVVLERGSSLRRYRFECPRCGSVFARSLSRSTWLRLESCGCEVVELGPGPITESEIQAFVAGLDVALIGLLGS